METDATRMCALLVGLPDVNIVGVGDWPRWLRVVIEVPSLRPQCGCGGVVHRHGVRDVEMVSVSVSALDCVVARSVASVVAASLSVASEPHALTTSAMTATGTSQRLGRPRGVTATGEELVVDGVGDFRE